MVNDWADGRWRRIRSTNLERNSLPRKSSSRSIGIVIVEPLGLTQVQYSILAATSYLESAEHVTQQNVSDQLSMDKMIVSEVVKTLEKRNFLTRKPHSGPERRRNVQRDFHQARHQI